MQHQLFPWEFVRFFRKFQENSKKIIDLLTEKTAMKLTNGTKLNIIQPKPKVL